MNLWHSFAECARNVIEVVGKEIAAMQNLDSMRAYNRIRKVLRIQGYNSIAPACNCGCEYISVVMVGNVGQRNHRPIFGNQAIARCLIHEVACAFSRGSITVKFIAQECIDPFPMEICRPLRSEEVTNCQLQKKDLATAQGRGCWHREGQNNASRIDISQVEDLRFAFLLAKNLLAFMVNCTFIGHDISHADTTTLDDLPVRDDLLFKKLDYEGREMLKK